MKNTKKYMVKLRGYHEKKTTWVVARHMVNDKKLVEHFEETRVRGSNLKKRRH